MRVLLEMSPRDVSSRGLLKVPLRISTKESLIERSPREVSWRLAIEEVLKLTNEKYTH